MGGCSADARPSVAYMGLQMNDTHVGTSSLYRRVATRALVRASVALVALLWTLPAQAQPPETVAVMPIYRYFNPTFPSTDTFFTQDFFELQCGGPDGYIYQGVTGYSPRALVSGTSPLNRYWNSNLFKHFYTLDPSTVPSGYISEFGTGFLFPASGPGLASFPVSAGPPGFIYAPPPSAPCTLTCTILKPTADQSLTYSGSESRVAPISLEANVPGQLSDWTITSSYTTQEGRGPFNATRTARSIYGTPKTLEVTQIGGKLTFRAASLVCESTQSATLSGAGNPRPEFDSYLISIHTDPAQSLGPTSRLLIGIGMKESSMRQFAPLTIPTMSPNSLLWPVESGDAAPTPNGSHVGLMQVEINLGHAFDWKLNALFARDLFKTKMQSARNNATLSQRDCTGLPAPSLLQLEQNAVLYYGPHGTSDRFDGYWIPVCSSGQVQGKKCQNGTWNWAVNPAAGIPGPGEPANAGNTYVNLIYSYAQ